MSTYKQVQARIARLQRDAETAKKTEAAAAVEKFKALIALYGLTAADLGLDGATRSGGRGRSSSQAASKSASRRAAAKKSARRSIGVARYRDPKSGRTWTGVGRVPNWLASVKDREAFRIGEDASRPEPGAAVDAEADASVPETTPTSKAARKTGTKAAAGKPAAKKRTAAKKAARKAARKSSGESPARQPDATEGSGASPAESRPADAAAAS